MTRNEYNQARRMCRENGRYALTWLSPEHANVMDAVLFAPWTDDLAERADIVNYCRRTGRTCTPRHTASRELLARFNAR